MLDDELSKLRHVIAHSGSALEIDDALLPLVDRQDPYIIKPILLLLNESGDQHGMFSILHAAESFDDTAYIAGLLDALPTLTQTCLWWASTLIIRVLNSDASRSEMVRQLREAPAPTKDAAAQICDQINGEDIRFLAKTTPVLIAAKE